LAGSDVAGLEQAMTLSATLSAAQAAARDWDVVVIGAGVGGSMAARELARMGCRVLLIDKKCFPRRKVCGACLNASALTLLSQVGLPELIQDLGGIPLQNLALHCGGRRVDLPLSASRAVSREALDAALIRAAITCGTEFLPETTGAIIGDLTPGPFRTIALTQHDGTTHVRARIIIVASGLGAQGLPSSGEWTTQVAPTARVGVSCIVDAPEPGYQSGTIWMAVGRSGYVGLVRLEDGRLNVAAALDRDFLAECKSPCNAAGLVLTEAGFPCPASLPDADWLGTVSLTRRTSPLANRQVFLIGDAASYIEPFTGEGIAWAMQSGLRVAPWARQAVQGWSNAIELGWTRDYRNQIRRQQWTCRWTSYLLHHSRLQALSMSLLQRWPWLARSAMNR
jgi:flavin-dependent dehydrogenase